MYLKSYSLCNAGEANYTKEKFSRGGKILFAFLLIVYILPLFINLIIDTQPIFRLPIKSSPILFSILLLILVSIIALIIGSISTPIIPKNVGPIKPLPKSIIVIFSIITISVGINILLSGLTQWRYTTSISSNSKIEPSSFLNSGAFPSTTSLGLISFFISVSDPSSQYGA